VVDIVANLVEMFSTQQTNTRSVKDGLSGIYLRNCGLDLGEAVLADFFLLWHLLANIQLEPKREDILMWRWTSDDMYSPKSGYDDFFPRTMRALVNDQIWRYRGPYSCKFFLWLVSRNMCSTTYILQRRGLPRPVACHLGD
jgi:hypothetical protein